MSYDNNKYRKLQKEIDISELFDDEEDFKRTVMKLKAAWKREEDEDQEEYESESYLENSLRCLRKPSRYQVENLEKMAEAASLMLGFTKEEAKEVAKNFSSSFGCKVDEEGKKGKKIRYLRE